MSDTQIYIPHPKQRQLIVCPCNEILYGGAAGGGKTQGIGFDWVAHKARYGAHAKGLILRRTNPELEDMIRALKMMFSSLPDAPTWSEKLRSFVYSDGAILEMGYLESYDDVLRYQGREFNWMAWDELTQWGDPDAYLFLMTRLRSAHGIPVRLLATTNPGGPGHNWVCQRFQIDEMPEGGVVFRDVMELPNGEKRVWTRTFIKSVLSDNPSLDHDGAYRANLMNQPEHLRKMLLEGRWDVLEGAFFTEWDPSVHICQPHTPPKNAKRWMAGDWGTTNPYCFLWFYEAGNGDVYVYDELYGCVPGKTNVGTRETVSEVAQKIRYRENQRGEVIVERYLDTECWSERGHEITIAGLFAKHGVPFQQAIKKNKGIGIANAREYLKVVNRQSRIKVMSNCVNLIRTLPRIQVHKIRPEQYDSDGEDHAVDCLIYGLRRNTPSAEDLKRKINAGMHKRRLESQMGPYGLY